MWVMTVAMLAAIPAPWSVEAAPLLPEGLELTQVQPLSGQQVALLAHSEAAETWALLLMDLGQTPELVQAFHEEPRFAHPSGSEVFVLAGTGPTNVYRLDRRGDLKRLGTFDFLIDDLACTADGAQCVLASTDSGVVAVGRVSKVVQTDLRVSHVTISPSGTLITHDLPSFGCEVIRNLDPKLPQVISVCESRSRRFASFETLQQHFEEGGEYASCGFETTGWLTDSVLELGPSPASDFECALKPFRLDRRTLARNTVPVAPYPWVVLPCPHGGWQSGTGRIATACTEVIQLQMRGRGAERDLPPALPEAIALSAESVFIDVIKPASFSFERGRVKLPFTLDGPSVVTMSAKGVVVQPIVWPGGVITHSFDDGWHLLQSATAPLTVHFVQAD